MGVRHMGHRRDAIARSRQCMQTSLWPHGTKAWLREPSMQMTHSAPSASASAALAFASA